jgi:hypothetical protein
VFPTCAGVRGDETRGRQRTIATLMICVDEHDREKTQRTLGDLVAGALTETP